jgi:hypothetical protein
MTELDRPYAPAARSSLEDAVGAYRSLRAAEEQLDKARDRHNQMVRGLPNEDIDAYYQLSQEIFDEYAGRAKGTDDGDPQST